MTSVNLFNNISRIGMDNCDITNKEIENKETINYLLQNFSGYSNFSKARNLANGQPNIFLSGSLGGGINSSVIDDNSKLQIPNNYKRSDQGECFSRLFSTTPYLGKGPYDVNTENELNLSNPLNLNRKTNNSNTEVSHDSIVYYPLIPSIESTINNPNNLVEGVAYDGWVRGGIPSRLFNKMQDEKKNITN